MWADWYGLRLEIACVDICDWSPSTANSSLIPVIFFRLLNLHDPVRDLIGSFGPRVVFRIPYEIVDPSV